MLLPGKTVGIRNAKGEVMVSKKRTPVKKSVGKLKVKKETIRDLDPKGRSSEVKGGRAVPDTRFCPTESCHQCK